MTLASNYFIQDAVFLQWRMFSIFSGLTIWCGLAIPKIVLPSTGLLMVTFIWLILRAELSNFWHVYDPHHTGLDSDSRILVLCTIAVQYINALIVAIPMVARGKILLVTLLIAILLFSIPPRPPPSTGLTSVYQVIAACFLYIGTGFYYDFTQPKKRQNPIEKCVALTIQVLWCFSAQHGILVLILTAIQLFYNACLLIVIDNRKEHRF
jgi:hypothetical protein